MSELVDSHAHLDLCGDPDESIAEARGQGVGRILTVGFDLGTSARAVELANLYPEVSASVGIHPHDADKVDPESLEQIERLSRSPNVVAIGETGLDFYRDRSPREAQKKAFIAHIGLARRLSLTLMVHTRDAGAETLEILAEHAQGLRTVLHCYSLTQQVEECAELGYFMSVAGNVTFPNAKALREAVTRIPKELILSETDSPWLSPAPLRGKANRPANVRLVVAEMARLRETSEADLAGAILANYARAFPTARV